MIDFNNIPVEPTITILNPDESKLITTNNITTFTWIRLEIKKNHLKGYKVRAVNGDVFDIHPNGKIYNESRLYWSDGLTGEVYDELLCNLI